MITLYAVIALLLFICGGSATAVPICTDSTVFSYIAQSPLNSHYYGYASRSQLSNAPATAIVCNGRPGYPTTIQSVKEHSFLFQTFGEYDITGYISQVRYSAGQWIWNSTFYNLPNKNLTRAPEDVLPVTEPALITFLNSVNSTQGLYFDPEDNVFGYSTSTSFGYFVEFGQCGNKVCEDQFESCLNCPSDCYCNVNMWKADFYTGQNIPVTLPTSVPYAVYPVQSPSIVGNLLGQVPFAARLHSYITITSPATYNFLLSGTGSWLRGTLYIDGQMLAGGVDSGTFSSNAKAKLSAGVHNITLVYIGYVQNSNFSLFWDNGIAGGPFVSIDRIYYTTNFCGDSYCNNGENFTSCPTDCQIPVNASITPVCGDQICSVSETELSCPKDCVFSDIPLSCTFKTPQAAIPAGIILGSDTLGTILSNQQIWKLPGIDHLAHGIDIFNGEELVSPIFQFTYCNGSDINTLHDVYRLNIYELPYQVYADAYPLCTFDSVATSYDDSSSFAKDFSETTGVSASLSVSGSGFGFSGGASYAYSGEKSVSSSSKSQAKQSGSLTVVTAKCYSSRVILDQDAITFHPDFAKDVSQATDKNLMLKVLNKYGTHYYKSADLGGKLTMTFSTSNSYLSTENSQSVAESSSNSFSASVGGWGMSASASGSYSHSVNQDSVSQSSFESKSSKSSVLTYGGAPGSFGPQGGAIGSNEGPSDWGSWAETVDQLPVPVTYKLDRIWNIIPSTWINLNGNRTQDLWLAAERDFYDNLAVRYTEQEVSYLGEQNQYTVEVGGVLLDSVNGLSILLMNSTTNPNITAPALVTIWDSRDMNSNALLPLSLNHQGPNGTWQFFTFRFVSIQPDLGAITGVQFYDAGQATGYTYRTTGSLLSIRINKISIIDPKRDTVYHYVDEDYDLPSPASGYTFPIYTGPNYLLNAKYVVVLQFKTTNLPSAADGLLLRVTVIGTLRSFNTFIPLGDIRTSGPDGIHYTYYRFLLEEIGEVTAINFVTQLQADTVAGLAGAAAVISSGATVAVANARVEEWYYDSGHQLQNRLWTQSASAVTSTQNLALIKNPTTIRMNRPNLDYTDGCVLQAQCNGLYF